MGFFRYDLSWNTVHHDYPSAERIVSLHHTIETFLKRLNIEPATQPLGAYDLPDGGPMRQPVQIPVS